MRKYEAMLIVRPEISDTDVQKIADRFKGVIEEHGGTVEKAAKWDKRRLAYEIAGFREGNYILMNFEADAKIPLELNRQMHITEDILRHRIFKLDD